jgi:hypothetical protein
LCIQTKHTIHEEELNSYTNGGRLATLDSIMPYPGTITGTKFSPVASASGAQVFPGLKEMERFCKDIKALCEAGQIQGAPVFKGVG